MWWAVSPTTWGLLAHAAAGELGSIRAGALAFVLDAVRASGLEGDTSLTGALEALTAALAEEEAEAPLEPGRRDVIRLMNLHKAKGLEAPVVVLAAPFGEKDFAIKRHIERTPEGRARGWLVVQQKDGFNSFKTVARPRGWAEKQARERVFEHAEDLRPPLCRGHPGGARTRGKPPSEKPGRIPLGEPWRAGSKTTAPVLELDSVAAPPRERLDTSVAGIAAAVTTATTAPLDGGGPRLPVSNGHGAGEG